MLTVTIFIGYGGSKAESVAEKLEDFLETDAKMDVFLASPTSCSLPANSHNFTARINQEMIKRIPTWASDGWVEGCLCAPSPG